ncbi:MAG TPA: carboxypeptidase regulatory-like domain-containing protein [Anaerolineales bacterium]|nr:carboxypeptidase regulatory-like domain-containing protein [Anaerolineales bacterium]
MNKLVAMALLSFLLASCVGANQKELTSFALPASVEVTFSAVLPQSSSPGEVVQFTLLDQVTGLEFNRQFLDVTASGEQSVSVTFSVPPGTLLKYRYTRMSATGAADEVSADGQAIRYRAYLVDGPGHVAYDIVAAWADLPMEQPTGQVSGTITEAGGNLPISNAVVVAAGLQTRTDADGHFLIAGLPQGLHNVLVYSPAGRHLPFQQGALVAAASDTPANIQLTRAENTRVTLWMTPPVEHTSSTPVFVSGDLDALSIRPVLALQPDGRYSLTLDLPAGVDIRYKYTLGDGLWNAEHQASGDFVLRQLVIPPGAANIDIEDRVASWVAGSSAPIWFELSAPGDALLAYIQFNFGEWSTPLPMWPLGEGHWAYKLYGPTNFAEPLAYRYCLDAACTILEGEPGEKRTVSGNRESLQQMQDQVEAWQEP